MIFSDILKSFVGNYRFQSLNSEADGDTDIESENLLRITHGATKEHISKAWIYFTVANVTILIITASLILSTGTFWTSEKNAVLRPIAWWCKSGSCLFTWSWLTRRSAHPRRDRNPQIRDKDGTLFAKPEVSIAREEPGAENDAAWGQYEKILTHVVTRDQILKLGKDPETVARFDNDYWGMGDDAYMVQMDVMHVSICLRFQGDS